MAGLDRIRNTPLWGMTAPARKGIHWTKRQWDKLRSKGGISGIYREKKRREQERLFKKQHFGTGSFPDEELVVKQRSTVFERPVKISILVPLYNTPEKYLTELLDSVCGQTYDNWELCFADGSDDEHAYVGEICGRYASEHPGKILYRKLEKNTGISGNTNACLELASGEYIGLLDHDDILHPTVLFEYVKAINEKAADYLYCDEVTFAEDDLNDMLNIHFKPDYAPDNLRANNYICHFSVFARSLLDGTELFRSCFDGSQDHDMILRLTDNAKRIIHIPKTLYYWRAHRQSVASGIEAKPYAIEAARGAVGEHLKKHGLQNFEISSTKAYDAIYRIRYEIQGKPLVSIIIPDLPGSERERCEQSIAEKTAYGHYEILRPDDTMTDVNGRAARINRIAAGAAGEYIILLSAKTRILTPEWIEELLMYAQREDVGAAGAKIYSGDKIFQAGILLGLGKAGIAGCSHFGDDRGSVGYMGRLCYSQNVSAVSGDCLMIKKSLFEAVGGLDEGFDLVLRQEDGLGTVNLSDLDFCLKLREKGKLLVFTPFAELQTGEQNGETVTENADAFCRKWGAVLEKGDPYYNQNFLREKGNFTVC